LKVADRSELKSGAMVAAPAAAKRPGGAFTAARIDSATGQQAVMV
jgi:hypothetical protein